jgi:hypothetical protein
MSDTARSRTDLQTLLADNVTGAISPQDLRDFLVTAMPAEMIGATDYWNGPAAANISTDLTTRGWHLDSQIMGTDCSASFGKIYYLTSWNMWKPAFCSNSMTNGFLGIATNSYASAATSARMLIRGVVYYSAMAASNSGQIGQPLYLHSTSTSATGHSGGIFSTTDIDRWGRQVGFVLPNSTASTQTKGKFWFDGTGWAVTGV